jgi:hypothetical protein
VLGMLLRSYWRFDTDCARQSFVSCAGHRSVSDKGGCTSIALRAAVPASIPCTVPSYARCDRCKARLRVRDRGWHPNDNGLVPPDGSANWPSREATRSSAAACADGPGTVDKLANDGHDTRSLAHYLGHRNLQSTARYTALAEGRFKGFWRD